MKLLFLFVSCLLVMQAAGQDTSNFYFGKFDRYLETEQGALSRIERTQVSSKEITLNYFTKLDGEWQVDDRRTDVQVKGKKTFLVSDYEKGKLVRKEKIKILEPSSNGFFIQRFEGDRCLEIADVRNVCPIVYHGYATVYFKDGRKRKDFRWENVAYEEVNQPDLCVIDRPANNAEISAWYHGGVKRYVQDVLANTVLPEELSADDLHGRFILSFVVDKTGQVKKPYFVDYDTDPKALTLEEEKTDYAPMEPTVLTEALLNGVKANQMPWIPALNDGALADFHYLIPFHFELKNNDYWASHLKTGEQLDENAFEVKETLLDKMAEYKGGELALRKQIAQSIIYPREAQEHRIAGKVIVSFIVNREGDVEKVKVVRGVDDLLDYEAMRVVNNLGKWTPGEIDGKTVNVRYVVPINFVLR